MDRKKILQAKGLDYGQFTCKQDLNELENPSGKGSGRSVSSHYLFPFFSIFVNSD